MRDPIQAAKGLRGSMPQTSWKHLGHTIYVQPHARLEFAHPALHRLFAHWLPPDWDCVVDTSLVGLYFATHLHAKLNGLAFVLKRVADQRGKAMRLPEEVQATRPKLCRYELEGRAVEIFLTKAVTPFQQRGWTCRVDGQLVGFGFRSCSKAQTNALLYVHHELDGVSPGNASKGHISTFNI